jgi:hypothetical protein
MLLAHTEGTNTNGSTMTIAVKEQQFPSQIKFKILKNLINT